MTSTANGTHAKDIALYFLEKTEQRYTASIIARTVNQAKTLLSADYSKDEIISVIDYIVDKSDVDMYSLGYLNSNINRILRLVKKEDTKEEVEKQKKESVNISLKREVVNVDESNNRNKDRINRYGIQSRKRKEYNFDMLKE